MGKASRTKQDSSRREKIAAQRAAAKRAERQRRLLLAGAAVVVVVAVVVSLVVVKLNQKSTTATGSSNGPTGAALTSVINDVTSVPASTLDKIGGGTVSSSVIGTPNQQGGYLAPVSGTTLTSGGKPEMLYVGAEYCPYCAAERWAMIVALSRFGTFSGLSTIHSSSSDVFANTPTFTFYGSSYTSKYLAFSAVEETRNYRQGNSTSQSAQYVPLQTPTAEQQQLLTKYDGQSGSIPFIDIGNKYVEIGNLAQFGPQALTGKSWAQIGAALKDPTSPIAKGIGGSANYLTAAICKLTNNQPATACTATITALESKL